MFSQEIINSTDIKVLLDVEKRFCLCGCGELVHARDSHGRAIKYVAGHNRRGKGKAKEPIAVEVNKIVDIIEARSHILTQAKIIHEREREMKLYKDAIRKYIPDVAKWLLPVDEDI